MSRHRTVALALAALLAPAAALAEGPYYQGELLESSDPAEAPAAEPQYEAPYDVAVEEDAPSDVSLQTFQAPLASYGDWQQVGSYGSVWRPRVPAGWRPYYYGRWEWTTEGWLWVSDEPFGWATYHYGRWSFDRGLGWFWVPGYQWAPAWVSWRYGDDAVGWSPLAPGLSLYVTDFAFVDFWWTFVPSARFCGGPVWGMAYPHGYARRWYDSTRPAPPRPGGRFEPGHHRGPAWGGPAPRLIEERSGRPLRPARIVTSHTPGRDSVRSGEIRVYRPEARPRQLPARGWDGDRRALPPAPAGRERFNPGTSGLDRRPAAPGRAEQGGAMIAPRPRAEVRPQLQVRPQGEPRQMMEGPRVERSAPPAALPRLERQAPAPQPRAESSARPAPPRSESGRGGDSGRRRD